MTDYSNWLLYAYDTSIVTQLMDANIKHRVKAEDGTWSRKVIPRCFATPERAFSQIRMVLSKFYNRTITEDEIPLPFASISRGGPVLDSTRSQVAKVRKGAVYVYGSEDPTRDEEILLAIQSGDLYPESFAGMKHPVPIKIPYQIEYWIKQGRHKDEIVTELLKCFNMKVFYISVPFNEPFGTKYIAVHLDSMTDVSTLEGGTDQDRTLRISIALTVDGWIPYDPVVIPIISRLELEYDISHDMTTIDEVIRTDYIPSDEG